MLTRRTGRINTAAFGIAALVLTVFIGLAYREWDEYRRANLADAQNGEITADCNRLLSSLLDAETRQRGFLLTGDESYLESYNRAVQALPNELASLKGLLAARPSESHHLVQLNALINDKLAELRKTIELRRREGAAPALAVALSDQSKQSMDAIRAVCTEIQQIANSAQAQASRKREAAAQIVLRITVVGSLLILFLFAAGIEPVIPVDRATNQRSWGIRYGAAVLATVAATMLRVALTPLIGPTEPAFSVFLFAVIFSAWLGDFAQGHCRFCFPHWPAPTTSLSRLTLCQLQSGRIKSVCWCLLWSRSGRLCWEISDDKRWHGPSALRRRNEMSGSDLKRLSPALVTP